MDNIRYNLDIEEEQVSIVLGMLLGDGGLQNGRNNCKSIYYAHSLKQIEYALFKKKLLENITGKSVHIKFVDNNGYGAIRIYPKQCGIISSVISKLYVGKYKVITRDVLNLLTLQGIAIWYMDDGSCSVGKHNGVENGGLKITLNTYLPFEDNLVLINYFRDKWGINWYNNYSKGSYRLGMGTFESRKFFKLINPYIIPTMKYKVKKSISELYEQSSNGLR